MLVNMKTFSNETRCRMSESAKRRCTLEWRQETSRRYETPLPEKVVRELYSLGYTQGEIAKQLGVTQKVIWGFMRRHEIKARVAAKRDQWGEKNHQWKGEMASYKAMHQRLQARFGTPKRCEQCGTTDRRRSYDWANMTGHYGDISDYQRLCRSCHWKTDRKHLNFLSPKGGCPHGD